MGLALDPRGRAIEINKQDLTQLKWVHDGTYPVGKYYTEFKWLSKFDFSKKQDDPKTCKLTATTRLIIEDFRWNSELEGNPHPNFEYQPNTGGPKMTPDKHERFHAKMTKSLYNKLVVAIADFDGAEVCCECADELVVVGRRHFQYIVSWIHHENAKFDVMDYPKENLPAAKKALAVAANELREAEKKNQEAVKAFNECMGNQKTGALK